MTLRASTMSTLRSLVLIVFLLSTSRPVGAQETVRVPGALWTFTIPQGWERIPDDVLKLQNDIVVTRAPDKVQPYVLGIWRKDNPQVYALVQPFPDDRMNSMTFEDVERIFGAASIAKANDKLKSSFADVITSSAFGSPQLDRDRKRVVVTLTMTDPQGRTSRGVTQGLLWAGGMLNLHAYAPADQFDQKLPELLALADNIAFDPGQSFEPGSKKRSGVSPALVGAFIGAAVAIIYGAYYQRRLHRNSAQPPHAA